MGKWGRAVDQLEINRRRHKRQDVAIPSRLLYRAMESCEIEIENISFSGFRALCDLDLPPGSFVSVDLPNFGLVRARIAWSAGGKIGVAFTRVMDVRRCLKAAAPTRALHSSRFNFASTQRRLAGA